MQESQVAGEAGIGIGITFSDNATKAFVSITKSGTEYTKEQIMQFLSDTGIVCGIQEDAIERMLREKQEGKRYLVAQSVKPVDGKDGWYEFLFQTNIDTKPKILKDGSVDYSTYGDVPFVEEGQKIVIYHPAVPCKDGENLRGETLLAKKGKDLARLKGKGFCVSEDGQTYTAKTPGRIFYRNDRLVVENELVIEGDASLSTGDITFMYDIHIYGNVLTGVMVKSEKGSIIVDGYVEACHLYAAKDVVLKNGMQGNGKGKIVAGGSVSGKFFEQVTIESGGDICANAIMNSWVTAKQDVIVSGRFGIIIGGEISAERCISATIVGNMSEVRTNLIAGVETDLFAKLSKVEREQEALENELRKITNGMAQIDILIKKTQRNDLKQQKVKLIRGKVEKDTEINGKVREKQEIMDQMSRANSAKIAVQKVVYPGTMVSINGVRTYITQEASHVEISAKGSVIEVK